MKGTVFIGSVVTAEFIADEENSGSCHLIMTHGRSGAEPLIDRDTVAPGARSRVVELRAQSRGFIRILVNMSTNRDKGRLTVAVDGRVPPNSDEDIRGTDTWVYSVM